MKIRATKSKDLEEITRIFVTEFGKKPYFEKWKYQVALAKIRNYIRSGSRVYVAEEEGKVVGFIIFKRVIWDKGDHIYIDEIVVDNKYQGRGIGRALMTRAEEEYDDCISVDLWTHRTAKAFEFYKNLGYKELKEGVTLIKNLK
jgi:ribosomal protein S18 acetylase RimI-like enzyme